MPGNFSPGQQGSSAQSHGGVRVVPARMHRAIILRFIGYFICLQDRQRIHIGANGDTAALIISQVCNDTCPSYTTADFIAKLLQLLSYALRRAQLVEAKLGVHVKIPAPFDDVFLDMI